MGRFAKALNYRLICFAVLILTTALFIAFFYGPALHYPFFFDDFNSLMNNQGIVNPQITSPAPALESLRTQPLRPNRALTWLTFAADYKLTGMNPAGFRIVNYALHGLCTILVYLILGQLWESKHQQVQEAPPQPQNKFCGPALAGALFFLCQPLALNTVIYISQRFGGATSFFYLAGFYAWLKGHIKPKAPAAANRNRIWLLLAGVSFWAALHCKEMAITFPVTILFYELYTKDPAPGSKRKLLKPAFLLLLVAMLLLAFAWQIGLFNQAWINIGFRSRRLWSPGIHFLSEVKVFFLYWKQLFVPLPGSLSLHHELQPCSGYFAPLAYAAVCGHLALLVLVFKLRRKAPLIGFGIAWFYLVLAPPYLFLPQRELLVEYKTYLAMPGISIIILGVFLGLEQSTRVRNKNKIKYFTYAVIGCWLIFLTMVTRHRRAVFRDPVTIWTDVLTKYPESRRALNNRAVAWLKKGMPQKTLDDFNILLQKHPDYARGFENRGRLRLYLKDYSGALSDFNHTLKLLPNEPELNAVRKEIEKLRQTALSKNAEFNLPAQSNE